MKFASSLLALALFAAGPALTQAQAQAQAQTSAPNEQQVAANVAAGQAAAMVWLTQLDNQMWGETWDQSSRVFRSNVPLATWMDAMSKTRGPLGRATSREVGDAIFKTTLQGQPDGAYVSILFVSKFPDKEPMDEMVTTVREPDGRWRVTGYSQR
jgi:hypothetical protein